ncbi:MAG: glutaminase A [Actinobacteria bacterium]|nr:glutaminase A [Actinomycetota bacterium]MCG2802646.1 glutaminase A [Cellulomonas sp.]
MSRPVSRAELPGLDVVSRALGAAHDLVAADDRGRVSQVYPSLAGADPTAFGLAVTTRDGSTCAVGQSTPRFTLMSVSKPFVMALVAQARGLDEVRALVGLNATGLPFSDPDAVHRGPGGRTNPMVNPGAIATTSLVPGGDAGQRWDFLRDGLSALAGRALDPDQEVLDCALDTTGRNRELARLLAERGALAGDGDEAVDLYTRQCSLAVDVRDVARMGAVLATGGLDPVDGRRLLDGRVTRAVLAVMATAGLYEASGDWLVDVGVPAKSGISGGIVVVAPGKGALGAWSPPLDEAGTSVRGARAAALLVGELGLDLFAATP